MRKVGWAGLFFDCPRPFRFAKLEGDANIGKLILVDDERQRLEFAWARVRRRKYDGQRFAQRRLEKAVGASKARDHISPVDNEHYEPLLRYTDPQGKMDRYAGYCPLARRIVEIAYHRGSPAQDRLVEQYTLRNLMDQSVILPHWWSYFDVSFTAPAGFRYESSRLNLGDMRVRLIAGRRISAGARITIGQIYPARLALQRQDLAQWLRALAVEIRSHYRPASTRKLAVQIGQIPEGELAQADLVLRRRFRPLLWNTPRPLRLYLIHHHQEDRLTFLSISDTVIEQIEEHFQFIRESLHWAGLGR